MENIIAFTCSICNTFFAWQEAEFPGDFDRCSVCGYPAIDLSKRTKDENGITYMPYDNPPGKEYYRQWITENFIAHQKIIPHPS